MTDKLHCPYCGEELSNDFGVIFCYNEACKIHGCELNEQVIRDIIDGKKAQDALKEIVNFFDTECEKDDLYFYNLIDDNIAKYREIISITKQENK